MAYWYTIIGIFLFAIGVPVINFISNLIAILGELLTAKISERIAMSNHMIQKISIMTEHLDSDDPAAIGFEINTIPDILDEDEE